MPLNSGTQRAERALSAGRLILWAALALMIMLAPARAQQYHTYAQIGTELLAAEQNYPSICKRYDLGASVQGRSIWALRISDNVLIEEDEPEFRYISSMHGDEVVGLEMCLYLIEYLTTNYGTDPRVTDIVNSVELWIVPLMNPDGFVLGRRENANWEDLNRNFPDVFNSPANTTTGREAETAVIMNWGFGMSFTLAANFHGGTLVTNYPYDGNASGNPVYTPTTDDDLFVWISEQYSQHNLPMWDGPFYHGITNGADWYVIYGGMQDWTYRYMGGNEVTIEISMVDKPPAAQLPTYWDQNRESMLSYLETSLIGVRGLVIDGNTGDPLPATIMVSGRDHPVYTDPDVGDYHRMLLPGTYDLTFTADGKDSLTVEDVLVASGPPTLLDVYLWNTDVLYPNGGEALHRDVEADITWIGNPLGQFQVQYTDNYGDTAPVEDGFESGALGGAYTTGGNNVWSVSTTSSHQGTYSARSGVITHDQNTWMTRIAGAGELSFWYRVSSETGYDFFNFYIDGSRKVHASGTTGTWTQYSTELSAGSHEVKWEYIKDKTQSAGSDAAWIDDVQLVGDNTTWTDVIALTPQGATSTSWTPVSPGTAYKVRARSYYGTGTYGAWDESDSTFTVAGPVPAVSDWGLLMLALLVCTAGALILRNRNAVPCDVVARRGKVLAMRNSVFVLCATSALACWSLRCLAADPATDIHAAAAAGDVQRLNALLTDRADLALARDAAGQTPLHAAARNLQLPAVERLLNARAEVNAVDRDGMTALHRALLAGIDSKEPNARRESVASTLIKRGADVKAAESQGKSPLHLAAMKGRTSLLDLLLESGADLKARDTLGRTPLHDAAMYNHAAVIDWLVAKGADVKAADKQGDTPLHCAAMRFRKEAAERLAILGAEVNVRNARGQTPLHVAASAGPDEPEIDRLLTAVADVLLIYGAEVNAVDKDGFTPLHYALEKNRTELATLLRGRGAQ